MRHEKLPIKFVYNCIICGLYAVFDIINILLCDLKIKIKAPRLRCLRVEFYNSSTHLFVKRVSAQDVDVEVMDALSSVIALVGHKSKTVFKAKVCGYFANLFKALAKGDGVFFSHLGDVSIVLLGDEQKMDGGLRRNVTSIVVSGCLLSGKWASMVANSAFS